MLYFAYIDTLDEAFTAAHLRWDEQVIAYSRNWSTGQQVASVEITILNTGLDLLAPGRKAFFLLSYSPDGTAANAIGLARGRILSTPDGFGGETLTFTAECAPKDNRDRLEAAAKALDSKPHVDRLFTDISDDNLLSGALVARPEQWIVDPWTHEIRRAHLIDGQRVVDIGHQYSAESFQLAHGDLPANKLKAKLVAEWQQTSVGYCDVAPRLMAAPWNTTMDTSHISAMNQDMPGSAVDFQSEGWQLVRSRAEIIPTTSGKFFSGRTIDVRYRRHEYELQPGGGYGWTKKDAFTQTYREQIELPMHLYKFNYVIMQFSYHQQRRETAAVEVTIDNQDINFNSSSETIDLGEVHLGDLLAFEGLDHDVGVYEPDGIYEIGDLAIAYRKVWRLAKLDADGSPGPIFRVELGPQREVRPGEFIVPQINTSNWVEATEYKPAIADDSDTFFETDRGRQAIEHFVLRAKATLLSRQKFWKMSFKLPFEDGVGLSLDDEVRLEAYAGPGKPLKPVRGKVVDIRHDVPSSEVASITVTIAVSVGTGITKPDPAGAAPTSPYSKNWAAAYFAGRQDDTSVVDGVAVTITPGAAQRPVNTRLLPSAGYSVMGVDFLNQGGDQLVAAQEAAIHLRDPALEIQRRPTKIRCKMRPLSSTGVLRRDFTITAEVLRSPRGINLSGPGEP